MTMGRQTYQLTLSGSEMVGPVLGLETAVPAKASFKRR